MSGHHTSQDEAHPVTQEAQVIPNVQVTDSSQSGDTLSSSSAPSSRTWTDTIPRTDHNWIFLEYDHGSTVLGPLSDWNDALRIYTSMVFSDGRAACVYWGSDRIAFYNEKFSISCGSAHPYLMGKPFRDAFPDLVDEIEPIFKQVTDTGETVEVNDIELFPVLDGIAVEMYFKGHFSPLRNLNGEIEGVYNTFYDSTVQVLSERRQRVRDIIAAIQPRSVDETLALIVEALRENPKDITMAILYSLDDLVEGSSGNLNLQGTIGVKPGHRSAPVKAKLETDDIGLIPFFRRAAVSQKPVVLSQTDGSLQAANNLFHDVSWCGHGEPARVVVISLLQAAGRTLGFFVQGTNPRRTYDDATRRSIVDVILQMETKWAASLSIEQAIQREQLLIRRAIDSERRLRDMAKIAPLGMCQITPDETIEWANDQYYEITGHDRSNPHMRAFHELVAPCERAKVAETFQTLFRGPTRMEREIRLQRPWHPPSLMSGDNDEYQTWILAVSFPTMKNGKLNMLMGFVSDISHQKWAESVQARNAATAILEKHRQEEFIDTTSHEMRNPLSAITQLADGISKSLAKEQNNTIEELRRVVKDNVEAADIILACAAHQKRVIDDVLILSRLKSQMLSITPVVERPSKIVTNTIKMLRSEAAMNGVEIEAVMDQSHDTSHVDYVLVDPSRLTQILINLISNSIKFVATQQERKISVVYGAQNKAPPRIKTIYGELCWSEPSGQSSSTSAEFRANRDGLFLYFCVQDTGTGMTQAEMDRLFKRFSQGNPRTHVTYGGSGLGLYTCKQLAEKQGGGIGAAAIKGKGSVFAFYVQTRAAASSEAYFEQQEASIMNTQSDPACLPSRVSPQADVSTVKSPPKAPSFNSQIQISPKTAAQRSDHRVLLVEDNLINQKILAKQLRNVGFIVTVADHGEEALQILSRTCYWLQTSFDTAQDVQADLNNKDDFDIVLMDWEMPVMNGLECCREIRRREEKHSISRHLPVIGITANVREEQRYQAIAAGMDQVLSKPFTIDHVVDEMRRLLPGRRVPDS